MERRGLISRDPTKPRALRSDMSPKGAPVPETVVMPIIGKVAAGTPITAQENVEGEFVLPASFARASDGFMLRVQGDSMIDAAILDGDLIMVRPQRVANNGEIVVAMLDGEATVKRFYKEDGRVRLQPENRTMAPIYAGDVTIVGRVEAVVRSFSAGLADAPAMVAVRESLPWSLAGLALGFLAFLGFVPVSKAVLPAFGVMAFALLVILACRLALHLKRSWAVLVPASAAVFLLALPQPVTLHDAIPYLQRLGGSGLFLAMISALAVALGGTIARRFIARPAIADVAGAAFVIALAALLFAVHLSLGTGLTAALHPLARLGDTWSALIVITALETLLWTFGIHGPATLAAVVTPVYLTLQFQNTAAFSAHRPLPHIVVVSLFLFVFPGGAGATLPVAALFAISKVPRLRTLGRLTIVPAIFNINEPLIFGTPIAMNPFFVVPFTLVPLLLATLSWLAVAHGAVARPAFYMPSMIPSLVSTFLATLDWRAVVLMVVNLLIALAVYLPFVRAYERHETA